MNEKDLRYIISVLKGIRIEHTPDWFSTLGFLQYHRIAGLFYHRAKRAGIVFPAKADEVLSDVYQAQKRKTKYVRAHLKELSAVLLGKNVEHVIAEGGVLSNLAAQNSVYADGERAVNGIDVLVKRNGILAVLEVLKSLGYVQGAYDPEENRIVPFSKTEILKRRMAFGETTPFLRLTDLPEFPFMQVDINFSLGDIFGESERLLNDMIDFRGIYRGKIALSVANEVLFFLHLIIHRYKESEILFMAARERALDLYKLADIYYLWAGDMFDKKIFNELVELYGMRQEVGSVLGQVGRIFEDASLQAVAKGYGDTFPLMMKSISS